MPKSLPANTLQLPERLKERKALSKMNAFIPENDPWKEFRKAPDGRIFGQTIRKSDLSELVKMRISISTPHFNRHYAGYFPLTYMIVDAKGKPRDRRISWVKANVIIDAILAGDWNTVRKEGGEVADVLL